MEGLQNNASSDIKLVDRSKLKITGVIKLLELSAKEVLVKTNLGDLLIKGSNIEMLSLNDNDNTINLIGKFNNISYTEATTKDKSFFSKLLK